MDVDEALHFVAELVVEKVPAVADSELNAEGALSVGKGGLSVEEGELGVEGLREGGFHGGRWCIPNNRWRKRAAMFENDS